MVDVITRNRNHRKKNCGTCESITQAYYYLTSEPVSIKKKLIQLRDLKIPCEEINGLFVFIFPDESLLAYCEKKGFYTVDTFLRKSKRRMA